MQTTFRYTSIWYVTSKTGIRYRVVSDSDGDTMTTGEIRDKVIAFLNGFGEQVTIDNVIRSCMSPTRYVRNGQIHTDAELDIPIVVNA